MITRRRLLFAAPVLLVVGCGIVAFASVTATPTAISGNYLEVRSCDVYTGPCFANGEMNIGGHEAILSWSIAHGSLDGVKLDGLKVVAVVQAQSTLGDVNRFPQPTHSVLIVDEAANRKQRDALVRFVQSRAGTVLGETVQIDSAPISVNACPECTKGGCAHVRAGNLVEIETRCLNGKDCVCGNEELFYPPLTHITNARPAYTTAAVFRGDGLGTQFDEANRRSAYLGSFSQ
jgi:hypothetical protein